MNQNLTSEQKPIKGTFTVLLVGGQRITHTYDAPLSYNEAKEFVERLVGHIAEAMTRGKARFLYFESPHICYNPDNVLGVEYTFIEAKEFEEAIRKAQRKAMGYTKD